MTNKEEGRLIQSFLNEEITIEELIKEVSDSALDEGYEDGFGEGCSETERKVYCYISDIRDSLDELEDSIR